jgi:hypothetical protein
MSNLCDDLFTHYHVLIEGDWPIAARNTLSLACDALFQKLLPNMDNICWIEGWVIRAEEIRQLGLTSKGLIRFNAAYLTPWTVVHEFGHAWDFAFDLSLSARMRQFTQSWGPIPLLHELFPTKETFWYHPGALPPPCGKDGNFNRLEDFAEAVAAYIYADDAKSRAAARGMAYMTFGYESFYATPRGRFMHDLIEQGGE